MKPKIDKIKEKWSLKNFQTTDKPYVEGKISYFIWYKILYPICNFIGLNKQLNILRHNLGMYPKYSLNGRCQWCGEVDKCLTQKEVEKEMETLKTITLDSPLLVNKKKV